MLGFIAINAQSVVLFKIKEAYIQSWIKSATNKGTDMVITVANVTNGVVFDSIVVNSRKMPVIISGTPAITVLKGFISDGPETKLDDKSVAAVDQQDMVLYTFLGVRGSAQIESIRKKETKKY